MPRERGGGFACGSMEVASTSTLVSPRAGESMMDASTPRTHHSVQADEHYPGRVSPATGLGVPRAGKAPAGVGTKSTGVHGGPGAASRSPVPTKTARVRELDVVCDQSTDSSAGEDSDSGSSVDTLGSLNGAPREELVAEVIALERQLAQAAAIGSELVAAKMEADARIAAQAATLEDMRQELAGIRVDDEDAAECWRRKLQRRDNVVARAEAAAEAATAHAHAIEDENRKLQKRVSVLESQLSCSFAGSSIGPDATSPGAASGSQHRLRRSSTAYGGMVSPAGMRGVDVSGLQRASHVLSPSSGAKGSPFTPAASFVAREGRRRRSLLSGELVSPSAGVLFQSPHWSGRSSGSGTRRRRRSSFGATSPRARRHRGGDGHASGARMARRHSRVSEDGACTGADTCACASCLLTTAAPSTPEASRHGASKGVHTSSPLDAPLLTPDTVPAGSACGSGSSGAQHATWHSTDSASSARHHGSAAPGTTTPHNRSHGRRAYLSPLDDLARLRNSRGTMAELQREVAQARRTNRELEEQLRDARMQVQELKTGFTPGGAPTSTSGALRLGQSSSRRRLLADASSTASNSPRSLRDSCAGGEAASVGGTSTTSEIASLRQQLAETHAQLETLQAENAELQSDRAEMVELLRAAPVSGAARDAHRMSVSSGT